jgi:hypothetical protein
MEKINITDWLFKEYPIIHDGLKELDIQDLELFSAKHKSYGMGNISMGTDLSSDEDKKLALTALTIRINDKVQRLLNLIIKNVENPIHDENIEDTFRDLSIYGKIATLIIRDKWKK